MTRAIVVREIERSSYNNNVHAGSIKRKKRFLSVCYVEIIVKGNYFDKTISLRKVLATRKKRISDFDLESN